MDIFSEHFLTTPASEIANEIRTRGIYSCERAVRSDVIDLILQDIGGLDFRVNTNELRPVVAARQTYQNNFMALSRLAFNLVASQRVTSICDALLGDTYRVVGKRIYETRYGQYMKFHSDIGKKPSADGSIDGLGFIFYMCDVDDGAFEVVEGSQTWNEDTKGSEENDARLVATETIRRFPMPKGSYVIYNGRLLHRARPMENPGQARQSFHFQVNKGPSVGEPIYVNIGWLNDIDEKGKRILGYGVPPLQPVNWPRTAPDSIPNDDEVIAAYLRKHFGRFFASKTG